MAIQRLLCLRKPQAYILAVICFATLVSLCSSHTCIHDKLDVKPKKLELPLDETFLDKERSQDGGSENANERMLFSAKPIRIHVDYSNINEGSASSISFIKNVLMTSVTDYYTNALTVNYPVSGRVVFPYSSCGDEAHIPSYLQSGGSGIETDLILFVTTDRSDEGYLAYAFACFTDQVGRPIAGVINFNLNSIDSKDPRTIPSQVSTALHETAHVLGFSSELYDTYINPTTRTVLGLSNVVKTVTRNSVSIKTIVLPTVLSKAKTHFNCQTLDGLDLEDQGGDGSAGSHWERKILYNEMMTASDIVDVRYSVFTLGLLEGTGWYTPDYNYADPFTWGKNEGCAFITGSCESNGQPTFAEFCGISDGNGCAWGGQYKAACLVSQTKPATAYNYFNADISSLDSFSDNCPYYFAYESSGTCNDPYGMTASTYFPEAFGSQSSCFQNTLAYTSTYSGAQSSVDTGCFKTTCTQQTDGSYSLTVTVGTQTVTCGATATKVSVPGFYGKFYCPSSTQYCVSAAMTSFCRYGCLGRGNCYSGVCDCEDGWTGDACGTPVKVKKCSRCSGGTPDCYGDTCISGVILRVSAFALLGLLSLLLFI